MEELTPSLYAPFGQRDAIAATVTGPPRDQDPQKLFLGPQKYPMWESLSNMESLSKIFLPRAQNDNISVGRSPTRRRTMGS